MREECVLFELPVEIQMDRVSIDSLSHLSMLLQSFYHLSKTQSVFLALHLPRQSAQ
jgi:hypothetical protein